MNQIINKLNTLYNQTSNSKSGEAFIYNLFNYLEFIINEPQLIKEVNNQVSAQEAVDLSNLNQLRETILNESKTLVIQIKSKIKNNINIPIGVTKAIEDYDNFISGRLKISNDYTINIIEQIRVILANMIDAESTKPIIDKYAIYDENKVLTKWNWSKKIETFEEQKSKVDRIAPTRIWFSWHSYLFLFHQIFSRYEEIWKEEYKKNGVFAGADVSTVMNEIKAIIDNKPLRTHYYFSKSDLEHHLAQFHTLLIMPSATETTASTTNKNSTNFDNNTLTINGADIKFKNDSKRALLLKFLFKNKNQHKKWHFEEWLADIDGEGDTTLRNGSTKHYTACDGIQKQVAQKTGITNFLIFNSQEVKLNPTFLA